MKFLTAIVDGLVAFVQRNPLTVLVILLLALAAPALLKGIATMILYAILGFVLFVAVLVAVFWWRVRSMRRRMEEQLGEFGRRAQEASSRSRRTNRREGEVHVYKTSDTPEKRVSEDVGDYVDFEETESE